MARRTTTRTPKRAARAAKVPPAARRTTPARGRAQASASAELSAAEAVARATADVDKGHPHTWTPDHFAILLAAQAYNRKPEVRPSVKALASMIDRRAINLVEQDEMNEDEPLSAEFITKECHALFDLLVVTQGIDEVLGPPAEDDADGEDDEDEDVDAADADRREADQSNGEGDDDEDASDDEDDDLDGEDEDDDEDEDEDEDE